MSMVSSTVSIESMIMNRDSVGNPSYNQNPPQFDKALVTRDSPIVCGNDRAGTGDDYNLPLHVGALFIVLFVSSTACAFPLMVVKAPRLRIPPTFLFVVRHFGTGVLIATAFVHLLPTAFISLTDPCLPPFWNEQYPAMAGAIALAAVFLIAVVEMIFSPGRNACAYPVNYTGGDIETMSGEARIPSVLPSVMHVERAAGSSISSLEEREATSPDYNLTSAHLLPKVRQFPNTHLTSSPQIMINSVVCTAGLEALVENFSE